MKKLLIVVVAIVVLAGCAGTERDCIENALDIHLKEVERLEALNDPGREECDLMEGPKLAEVLMEAKVTDPRWRLYKCNTYVLDDCELATSIWWETDWLMSRIKSCLRK